METNYYSKYLKYKAKYLDLQKSLIGGGFSDILKDVTKGITNEHMDQITNNDMNTDQFETLKKAIEIINSPAAKEWLGIKNRDKQPKWYKENPALSTLAKNPVYLKEFYEELNKYKRVENPTQNGGKIGGGKAKSQICETSVGRGGKVTTWCRPAM